MGITRSVGVSSRTVLCGDASSSLPCPLTLPVSRSFSPADVAHSKKFDGECSDGSEIRMYEGNGDNPGTAEERAIRCSAACRAKKSPLSGSWSGFVAEGFIVIPTTGRCYCESSASADCSRGSSTSEYDRYDWN